jgi:WD40 repeat protein
MVEKKRTKTSGRPRTSSSAKLPPGVRLANTLRGHAGFIGRIAWSPNGQLLASPSEDKTIRLWQGESGEHLGTLQGHEEVVTSVTFDWTGRTLASGSGDQTVKLWDLATRGLIRTLKGHGGDVTAVAFNPSTNTLASGSNDSTVKLWDSTTGQLLLNLKQRMTYSVAFDPSGRILAGGGEEKFIRLWNAVTGNLLLELESHGGYVYSIVFGPAGRTLAAAGSDGTINVWDTAQGRLLLQIEGHTDPVDCLAFSQSGRVLASKSDDMTVRFWNCDSGQQLGSIIEEKGFHGLAPSLAFHPQLPILATVGSDPGTSHQDEGDRIIHIWNLNFEVLLAHTASVPTSHYVNAKVVLLGDTGVGKSGLSLVLNGEPFEPTDSTPGRKVWTFQSKEVELSDRRKQTRETLLWDLAGQPGYRVIHQLHLNEVAVALVVFDAHSETDPLAGVRHWERALRLAKERQGSSSIPMKKILVSARNDRGTVSVSKERLEALLKEFGFDGYFETSAKEGWKIGELRQAIEHAIPWEMLPEVSSSVLFADIKGFLLEVKQTGRLIAPASQLYDDFAGTHSEAVETEPNLRDQFDTCISRLENRDLIRRLTFGDYVLLQPELLDAYASAMVNAAKEEPDGLGSLADDAALAGQFYVPREQKVEGRGQEQLLLHATVEELVRYDLALRESAADGRYLVFPSQFNRDYEDAPEPKARRWPLPLMAQCKVSIRPWRYGSATAASSPLAARKCGETRRSFPRELAVSAACICTSLRRRVVDY